MCDKNKRTAAAGAATSFSGVFRCPVCFYPLEAAGPKSLQCAKRHCFDLSRHGYVNFLSRPASAKYDKQLFESRKTISRSGFFQPLDMYLSEQIADGLTRGDESIKIFDAGCGEGSRLSSIREIVSRLSNRHVAGVGLDISKEAIDMASRQDASLLWCVGDLAKCPLQSDRFAYLVNILSPSNYGEFQRILADGGVAMKVVPGPNYLIQLRERLYRQAGMQPFSDSGTQDRFRRYFDLRHTHRLQYEVSLDQSLIGHLVRMTPLSWRAEEEGLRQLLAIDSMNITIDLTVLIGKKYR